MNHLESQIIDDPTTKVQMRAPLINQGHTTLISKVNLYTLMMPWRISTGSRPCKKNLTSSKRIVSGNLWNYPKEIKK